MDAAKPITSTRIKERPPAGLLQLCVFNVVFLMGMVGMHGVQILFLPLWLHPTSRPLFWTVIRHSKQCFGQLLIAITRIWAPTRIVLTAETTSELERLVRRNRLGEVVGVRLPPRAVFMASHSCYLDWLYIWNLLYLAQIASGLIIVLKASLKWVPLVGPAMQLFRFVFLARSWEGDKVTLSKSLQDLVDRGERNDDPFTLLIFPEGTLVSRLTRPASAKWAAKLGVEDMRHCLMPRSTGLLFCLRALKQRLDDIPVVDITLGYPGIPPRGYAQDYYTLQSVFGASQPPPAVHMHIRTTMASAMPLGAVGSVSGVGSTAAAKTVGSPSEAEREAFDLWLRERWQSKDELLERFYTTGSFGAQTASINIDMLNQLHWLNVGVGVLLAIVWPRIGWLIGRFIYRLFA